jgi:hypothetical protein
MLMRIERIVKGGEFGVLADSKMQAGRKRTTRKGKETLK